MHHNPIVPPHYADESVTLHHGNCLDVLRSLSSCSVDSVVTDPPYGLSNTDPAHVVEALAKWATGERDFVPAGRGFMGKSWDAFVPPPAVWDECLRVLKPGGHLLAFAGSRTFDLMTLSIRFAGFDIRDGIAWLYGSGFPKSLDVSKAIDKAAGATREASGERGNTQCSYLDRGEDCAGHDDAGQSMSGATIHTLPTAPATPAAQQWAGWGTALKPAFEPIVVARKPLAAPGVNVLDAVESALRARGITGEIKWTNEPASGAARRDQPTSSSATPQQSAAGTSASPAGGSATLNDEQPIDSSSVTITPHGATPTENTSGPTPDAKPLSCETKSLPLTETPAPAATSAPQSSSPSITSTEAAPPTARRRGARSTPRSGAKASLPVTESFAGTATGLTGSRATVRIDRLTDGTFVWPEGLPTYAPGGPITVAANVLAHGTGALNIDGCRVPTTDRWSATGKASDAGTSYAGSVDGSLNVSVSSTHDGGRWPANVLLDGDTADALDEQTGVLTSGKQLPTHTRSRQRMGASGIYGASADPADDALTETYGDSGGPSRFFPTFRYQAKAPARERAKVGDVAHPTVKPLELMRWLVRLVTPPGGTVLEPFAGSGTTVEAAVLEGMSCVAVEQDADYLPLILARLARNAAPTDTEDQLDLFSRLSE